jgi:hypothetical protein
MSTGEPGGRSQTRSWSIETLVGDFEGFNHIRRAQLSFGDGLIADELPGRGLDELRRRGAS